MRLARCLLSDRCIKPQLKSLALGLYTLATRTLGKFCQPVSLGVAPQTKGSLCPFNTLFNHCLALCIPSAQSYAKFNLRGMCTVGCLLSCHCCMHPCMQKCIQARRNKCREDTHASRHQHVSAAECISQYGSPCPLPLSVAPVEWFKTVVFQLYSAMRARHVSMLDAICCFAENFFTVSWATLYRPFFENK